MIIRERYEVKNRHSKMLKNSSRTLLIGIIIGVVLHTTIMMPKTLSKGFSSSNSISYYCANKVKNGETKEKNIQTLMLLKDDIWPGLTTEERRNVCQTIADIEQCYLGLPHGLIIRVEMPDRETVLGYYNDTYNTIVISPVALAGDSAVEAVEIICHEAYHAYQHRMVEAAESVDESLKELLVFRKASIYQEEFCDYVDGNEDPERYYWMKCEIDARQYARNSRIEYYESIY